MTKTETVQGVTHVYGYAYDTRGRLTDVTTDGAQDRMTSRLAELRLPTERSFDST